MSVSDNEAPKKKRGRKTKTSASPAATEQKVPKKRGRKPKGGKIVAVLSPPQEEDAPEPNIILHLKCGMADLERGGFMSSTTYEPDIPVVENFQFEQSKGADLNFHVINQPRLTADSNQSDSTVGSEGECDDMRGVWRKLKELAVNLHTDNISDKKSACFWCTTDFDNPPIYIPKHELNDSYHCYGCFCSPECATAYLFKEPLDSAARFERYHMLNHLYCKIYDYEKNVKPAPDPYYTLEKYYGNLSIQEYRRLLKNERLLLIVDKPLTRTLPELHEDNDDFVLSNKSIPSASKYKLRRRTQRQTKSEILSENFNLK